MTKQQRHLRIKDLVSRQAFQNQNELLDALLAQGIDITQATLSRDCGELGIVRMHTVDSYKLALQSGNEKLTPLSANEKPALRSLISVEVRSIEANESMIVMRTLTGRAHGVASYLDSLDSADILGTIAGDDTLIVIPKSVKRIEAVVKFIKQKVSETD